MGLSVYILISLVLGILFGAVLHEVFPDYVFAIDHYLLEPGGQIFLRLIQFVVVPIVFSSLIMGLTRIQNTAQIGRYILKLFSSYLATSILGITIGLVVALVIHPGTGLEGVGPATIGQGSQSPDLLSWIINLIPTNPLAALSESNLLQIIISGALIGIGIQKSQPKSAAFVAFVESVYAISESILAVVLYLAPVGVFSLMASVIAKEGVLILLKLITYMVSVISAIGLMFLVYLLVLALVGRSPRHFLDEFFPSLSLAFATASSNAALPVALKDAEKFQLDSTISSFAIPLGTALKRDGMAVGQIVNALFVAQLYNIAIDTNLIISICLSTLLVSFCTAGVPGGGIVMMTTIFNAAGLPLEGVALLAGVDRLMDSFHTILNLQGNVVNAIVLARWEGASIKAEG